MNNYILLWTHLSYYHWIIIILYNTKKELIENYWQNSTLGYFRYSRMLSITYMLQCNSVIISYICSLQELPFCRNCCCKKQCKQLTCSSDASANGVFSHEWCHLPGISCTTYTPAIYRIYLVLPRRRNVTSKVT